MYPIAPQEFVVAFGNQRSYEATVITQRYNGGVENRSTGMSINPVTDSWSLSLEIHGLHRYNAVSKFIAERDGDPFRFDWDGDGIVDNSLYRIESHKWDWSGFYHWKLSVELKGLHRP